MKLIKLTRGYWVMVDEDDYEYLLQWKWHATSLTYGGYAAAGCVDGKHAYMHRHIMNAPQGLVVDHRDHDTLNNQRWNLRIATRSQNQHNRRPHGKTSKLKGVAWHSDAKKWVSHISAGGVSHYLGLFTNENDAAEAYADAAKKYHSEFMYKG